jgi:hypothetical protein
MKEFDIWIKDGYYNYDPIKGKIWNRYHRYVGFTANGKKGEQYVVNSRCYKKQTTMARLAWRIYYGEWPAKRLSFRDKSSFNIKIDNMYIPTYPLPTLGKFSTLLNGITNDSARA